MEWNGRVALITGASSGIGRAVARELAARGARVALVARTERNLDALVSELGAERAFAFKTDVSDREAVVELPRRVRHQLGRLDIVINSAGRNHRGAFAVRSVDEILGILDTNLAGAVLLTHAALPLMEEDGVVVNVASLAGKVPVPDEAVYSASKSGLRAFGRALDTELALAGSRKRVLSVCPGPVDTGFLGDDLMQVPDLVFSQPMSSAEQVARAVVDAIASHRQETDVPALSGKLCTLGYLSPSLFRVLRPAFARLGARKKAVAVARRARLR